MKGATRYCYYQLVVIDRNLQKRRITEMLSQLPTEVDVMKLITLAITGSSPITNDKSVKGGAEGGKSMRRSSVLSMAAANGGAAANGSGGSGAPTRRLSTMQLPAGGGGGAVGDGTETGAVDSKAWKGLLARGASVKGGGSFASLKRV